MTTTDNMYTCCNTTTYEWDKNTLIREMVTYKSTNNTYDIWYFYDNNGEVIGFEYSCLYDLGEISINRIYYKKDLQGNVIGLLDSSGTEIATYFYDAWGNITDSDYLEGYEVPFMLNHITYRSYYRDDESGFYYLQSRYYDAEVGRFINADDVNYLGVGMNSILADNLYIYCNCNPINYIDTQGTIAIVDDAIWFGIAMIVIFTYAYIYCLNTAKSRWKASEMKSFIKYYFGWKISWIPTALFSGLICLAKTSKLSQSARSTDAPSWAKGIKPKKDEKAKDFAKRILDAKYGKGNWKTGPNTEYNKIVKYAVRHLKLK